MTLPAWRAGVLWLALPWAAPVAAAGQAGERVGSWEDLERDPPVGRSVRLDLEDGAIRLGRLAQSASDSPEYATAAGERPRAGARFPARPWRADGVSVAPYYVAFTTALGTGAGALVGASAAHYHDYDPREGP